MSEFRIDSEFKALIPPLREEEREQLEANLVANGCRDPLVIWRGILIDGHNRHEICTRLKIKYRTVDIALATREHVLLWIDENQLGRRNLTDDQRAAIAYSVLERRSQLAKMEQRRESGKKQPRIGRKRDSGEATSASPLSPTRSTKERSRHATAKSARISEWKLRAVHEIKKKLGDKAVAQTRSGGKTIREFKTEIRRAERTQRIQQMAAPTPLPQDQKYPVIYADPPWRYEYAETESRAIENQYPTMELGEICALPVAKSATEHAVLFLWVPNPKLIEGLKVIESWGFEYRTGMVWVKDKPGMGYYVRQQHELLLIAKRGELPAPLPADRPSSVITAPRGKHSAKPDEVYQIIERMYPDLPKLELFARKARAGWTSRGNQINESKSAAS
jgi:N6-adenosine-specific RNA methylase IME4